MLGIKGHKKEKAISLIDVESQYKENFEKLKKLLGNQIDFLPTQKKFSDVQAILSVNSMSYIFIEASDFDMNNLIDFFEFIKSGVVDTKELQILVFISESQSIDFLKNVEEISLLKIHPLFFKSETFDIKKLVETLNKENMDINKWLHKEFAEAYKSQTVEKVTSSDIKSETYEWFKNTVNNNELDSDNLHESVRINVNYEVEELPQADETSFQEENPVDFQNRGQELPVETNTNDDIETFELEENFSAPIQERIKKTEDFELEQSISTRWVDQQGNALVDISKEEEDISTDIHPTIPTISGGPFLSPDQIGEKSQELAESIQELLSNAFKGLIDTIEAKEKEIRRLKGQLSITENSYSSVLSKLNQKTDEFNKEKLEHEKLKQQIEEVQGFFNTYTQQINKINAVADTGSLG